MCDKLKLAPLYKKYDPIMKLITTKMFLVCKKQFSPNQKLSDYGDMLYVKLNLCVARHLSQFNILISGWAHCEYL